MLSVIYCLSQPYDARLLAVALIVCIAASFATFNLYPRAIAEADTPNATLWIVLTIVTAGSAIWTTHFTAMLAFEPGVLIGFEITPTITSFGLTIALTGAAFFWALYVRTRLGLATAGLVLGVAASAMHYTGVSGMDLAGYVRWDAPRLLLSVLCSVVLSMASLAVCGKGGTYWRRMCGALLFALSIAALHFIGMSAVTLVPNAAVLLPRNLLSGDLLGMTVGAVTLLIVGSAILAWLIDRRARRESERRVTFMARHDMLTKLPNRLLFEEVCKMALGEVVASRQAAVMLCLDLDGFKEVNDIFGHAAGDRLLVEVARRLRRQLDECCLAARLGGDEFAVLSTGADATATAERIAGRLLDALCAPYEVDGSMLDIGCSIGVARFPADAPTYPLLLTRADIALSRAKADGRGVFRYFELSMDEAMRERRRLGNDLRAALKSNQLHLAYQPQYDLPTGKVSGFEALLRWEHPERGSVSPATFIPIAEETGVILPLGEWVLREACREAARWPTPLMVAVNLSVAQFRQTGLGEMIRSILEETGLAPNRLEVEVTESLFLEPVQRTLQVLERLKDMGVRVAIDDFGTGFSSLSTLQSFAFDKIKIDRSFTDQIGHAAKGTAIVKAVIGLGSALGISVIAEGVETPEQVTLLQRMNCSQVQGYLFGKPLPISCYMDLLQGEGSMKVA